MEQNNQQTHLRGGGTASGDAPGSDAIEEVRERVDAARRVDSTCASSCSMIFSKSSCHFCADHRCGRTREGQRQLAQQQASRVLCPPHPQRGRTYRTCAPRRRALRTPACGLPAAPRGGHAEPVRLPRGPPVPPRQPIDLPLHRTSRTTVYRMQ